MAEISGPWSIKREARLRKLWDSDTTDADLAEKLGVTVGQMRARAKTLGLKSRGEARKERRHLTR